MWKLGRRISWPRQLKITVYCADTYVVASAHISVLPNAEPWFLLAAPATIRPGRCRIAEARNAAFTFTYHQNMQALAALGEVTYFNLQVDAALLAGTDYFCICLGLSPEPADITNAKGVVVPARRYR